MPRVPPVVHHLVGFLLMVVGTYTMHTYARTCISSSCEVNDILMLSHTNTHTCMHACTYISSISEVNDILMLS